MEENAQSVKNTHHFSFLMHTIAIDVNSIIGSVSQDKQVINTSKCIIKIIVIAGFTETSLNSQNNINQSNNCNSDYKYKIK